MQQRMVSLTVAMAFVLAGSAAAQLASSPWPTLGGNAARTNVYSDSGISQPAGY